MIRTAFGATTDSAVDFTDGLLTQNRRPASDHAVHQLPIFDYFMLDDL